RKKLGVEGNSPFVFLPISGPRDERTYITGVLKEIVTELPKEYRVVLSLGYPNSYVKPIRKGNVDIYGWVPNRFEYLKACDLVVSRAGHGTLTQSITYGKPMALIPTPSHTEQLNNAYRVKELGIAEVLEQKDVNKESLVGTVEKMLTDKRYVKRTEEVQREISGLNGLKTAVETIVRVAENHK
ncbi:MAG: hypothetical protein NWF14_02725, partial [Candidatus Bathyarchaeota archaeon]|nr:hypothetical protein [Candidatus Bathyarchaeota archaeon]